MNVGLLQCDHMDEQYHYLYKDYAQPFRDLFGKYAPELDLTVYDVCHGEMPARYDACEGYVITGSRRSVYENEAWIHALADFVRELHQHQHKLVGICFGHQMIAHALGGVVQKSERGWGIGIKPVQISQKKAWMQPNHDTYHLLLSHQDQVEVLPDGAECLGGNAHCPISMMGVGEHFFSVQAHPEFSKEFANALMESRIERIGIETVREAQATLQMDTDEALMGKWIQEFLTRKT